MASGLQNDERIPENLAKQLAFAVRSIQWSYAIFWSISTRQPGVLEWGSGYYNGDIKTRKTLQAVELDADQMGLQRSEQLRELYESLSAGESSQGARRPSAALSPEDLSEAEWYYLVCMSFVFNLGQGLPGKTLASGQAKWLYNAHCADSKVFSRSLLAKSASIQTVVCFPFLGGVIELGVSDLVLEDYALVQHFKTTFLEIPHPKTSKRSDCSAGNTRNSNGFGIDQDLLNPISVPAVEGDELNVSSPSSDGLRANQLADDSFMMERINGAASQVQSWQIMDDELSNCIHHSMDSSDCISQTLVDPENRTSLPKHEMADEQPLQDLQEEYNRTKMRSLDLQNEDLHYQGVIATLFKDSNQLVLGPHYRNLNHGSSFCRWKKGGPAVQLRGGTSQKLLKKLLFEVPLKHVNSAAEAPEENGDKNEVWRPEADDTGVNHAISERKRRERLNEKFSVLKTMVPSLTKDDKVSILDDAIEYLKELERRVEELESCRDAADLEQKTRTKRQDAREGTSDNYRNNKTSNAKTPPINKRKAREMDETGTETNYTVLKDGSADNITVRLKNKDVAIEIKCPWRDGIFLEIMDVLSILRLDSHSVQSSTADGVISLTIKSTVKASTPASAATITQALQRVTQSC